MHKFLEKQKCWRQQGKEISKRGVNLGEVVNSDLKLLVDNAAADSQKNYFQILFWKEQKKYFGYASKGFLFLKPPRLWFSVRLLEPSTLPFGI